MIRSVLLIILSYFIFTTPVLAVNVSIPDTSFTITDQPFTVNVSLSCKSSSCGPSYLRATLFPVGTYHYFGYTFNGSEFVNSSDCFDYFPVPLDSSGHWSGDLQVDLQVKIDTASSYYTGPGNYSFKVGRYTPSCSSPDWSNVTTVTVSLPTPTPSPSLTPTPTKVPSATPTTKPAPTPKKTPTPANTSVSTPVPSSSDTSGYDTDSILMPEESPVTVNYQIASIAGVSATASASPSAAAKVQAAKLVNFLPWIGGLLILGGFGSLVYIYLRNRNHV